MSGPTTENRPRQQLIQVGKNQNPFVSSDAKAIATEKNHQKKVIGEKSSHQNTQETNNFGAYMGMGTGEVETVQSSMMPTPQISKAA